MHAPVTLDAETLRRALMRRPGVVYADFDPNQERDESGKWTSTGGGGASGDTSSGSSSSAGAPTSTTQHRPQATPFVREAANAFNAERGLPPIREGTYVEVDEPQARSIADAFDALPAVDSSPETVQAYRALAREVDEQWQYAENKMGMTFESWTKEGQPYASSQEMRADVANNKHLYFFTGGDPHPYLSEVGPDGLTANDKLRAVHDVFGHAAEGYGFGARGEENAWLAHSQMLSPAAQRALTSETRGQNSWVNFGKQNYNADGSSKNVPVKDRPYAAQKAALLPTWVSDWRPVMPKAARVRQKYSDEQARDEHGRWTSGGGSGGAVAIDTVGSAGPSAAPAGTSAAAATSTPQFKNWFRESKVVDEDGEPAVVMHGTTGDFSEFSPDRASPESDLGAGFYFSSATGDVAANYAGEGPDLTQRIELLSEQYTDALADENPDWSPEQVEAAAHAAAREHLAVTNGGLSMPVYLSIQNPVTIGGDHETRLEWTSGMDDEGEYTGEDTGKAVEFYNALHSVAGKYGDVEDLEDFTSKFVERALDGDISASEIYKLADSSERLMNFTDDTGRIVSKEILRQAFEEAGFDGIIDHTVDQKFGTQRPFGQSMVGMNPDTVHYVAFHPEQIKSAIGNNGDFDPNSRDITKSWRQKYSDDQLRDESGKWTSGGGGGGGGGMQASDFEGVGRNSVAEDSMEKVGQLIDQAGGEKPSDDEQASAAKAAVGENLSSALATNPAWQKYLAMNHTSPAGSTLVTEALVRRWAESSSDTNERSLLLQAMAAEEFGLTDYRNAGNNAGYVANVDPLDANSLADAILGSSTSHAGEQEARDTLKGGYRAFVREMYTQTQADLAANGITSVYLARGVAEEHRLGAGEIMLHPMSSFSTSVDTAQNFAGSTAIFARVPASQIISTPRTGFGCLSEHEVVVLGGTIKAVVLDRHLTANWSNEVAAALRGEKPKRKAAANDEPIQVDGTLANADWTKTAWDLPPYKSPEFMLLVPDLDRFRTLPVYHHAVASGLITNDEWTGTATKDGTMKQQEPKRPVVRLDPETLRLARAGRSARREKYSDEQPRADDGKWTSGGGGGGGGGGKEPDGAGASATSPTTHPNDATYLKSDGKYHVKGDVDAAVRLIGEGKDVVLEQPRELSTLVDKLAAVGASGEKKVYDLCRVSVAGTNLFCSESAGYARVDMPQLSGHATPGSIADTTLPKDRKGGVDATAQFVDSLREQGHAVKATTEDAGYLRATQRELDGAKVAGMMKAIQEGKISDEALVVSKDNYIIDGHHRWAAKVALAYSAQVTMDMPILKVDISVIPLVEEAKAFANKVGIPQRGVGKSMPARASADCGCGTPCGCHPHVVVRLGANELRQANTLQQSNRIGVVYLEKYSPDQPRDQGRFASGGGGTSLSDGSEMGAAGGGAAVKPTMEGMVERLSKPDGGFTYQPRTQSEPKGGYALSIYPERSLGIEADKVDFKVLADYANKNADLFTDDDHYIGGWNDPASGRVFLDVSVVKSDRAEADQLARTHDQIAYFDLKEGKSVTVNAAATSGGAAKQYGNETRIDSDQGQGSDARVARRSVREINGQEADRGRAGVRAQPARGQARTVTLDARTLRRALVRPGVVYAGEFDGETSRARSGASTAPPATGLETGRHSVQVDSEERSTAAKITKYSDAQERDENGRWTSGGGGGGSLSDGSEMGAAGGGAASSSKIDPSEQNGVLVPVPAYAVAAAENKLANEGYPPAHMTARLDALLEHAKANPDLWEEGMNWYAREGEFAKELAARGNLTDDSGSAILAAVSPRQEVAVSEDQASAIVDAMNSDGTINVTRELVEENYREQLALAKENPKMIAFAERERERALRSDLGVHDVLTGNAAAVARWHDNRHAVLAGNWEKGLRIARGELPDDVLSGQKVWSFYDNIRNPETSRSVTIDGWTARLLTDDSLNDKQVSHVLGQADGRQASGRYEVMSRRIRETAQRHNITPLQVQAIAWTAYRAQTKDREEAVAAYRLSELDQ